MKQVFIVGFVLIVMSRLSVVRADYVLPYPSYMPGNTLYRVSRIVDTIKKYWYWGTIAQMKYRLALSDKYLVEAKTLFEYKQYLLGTDALYRSDLVLAGIDQLVKKGRSEGKDMGTYENQLIEAMGVHIQKLTDMKEQTPNTFSWTPEKRASTDLSIWTSIDQSIQIRQNVINQLQQKITGFSMIW